MRNLPAAFSAESLYLHHSSRLRIASTLGAVAMLVMMTTVGLAAQAKPKETPKEPTKEVTISADAGSCSADFLVQDHDHKPLPGADIKVKFHYGLFNLRRMSLEAMTGAGGRVRFEGLPRQPRNAFAFHVSHGDLRKTITDDPMETCQAQYTVVLQ